MRRATELEQRYKAETLPDVLEYLTGLERRDLVIDQAEVTA